MQVTTPQKKFSSPVKSLTQSPLPSSEKHSDRYLPSRVSVNLLSSFDKVAADSPTFEKAKETPEPAESVYSTLLKNQLFRGQARQSSTPLTLTVGNMLRNRGEEEGENVPRMVTDVISESSIQILSAQRKIPKSPFKILDAPSLQDDFYLNVLDWSSEDVLAVGLLNTVYLWSAATLKVTKLCEFSGNNPVTSLGWTSEGKELAVGTNVGSVHVFDVEQSKEVGRFLDHSGRVGTLGWKQQLLATASRDRLIGLRDLRVKSDLVATFKGHKQEVCGLKWSLDGHQLASGGNDNQVMLWDLHSSAPVARLRQHCAAVKALAWAPYQHGVLLSGGGTADRTIRFWNTLTLEHMHSIETSSQVCSLLFSKNTNEFVSTHGYSQNQIHLWSYPTRARVATLTGHSCRVLYLAISPDGETIVTGAGDETLRFWSLFPSQTDDQDALEESRLAPSSLDLR